MPLRFDLADTVDQQPVLTRVCRVLTDGGLVRLRLEEGDSSMVLATSSQAAERFLSLPETGPAALMVSGPQAAADLIHPLPSPAARFLQGGRGPLSLEFHDSTVDRDLLARIPEITRRLVQRGDWVSLTPPSGAVTRRIISGVCSPLLVCPGEGTPADESVYDVVLSDSSTAPPLMLSVVRIEGDQWQLSREGSLSALELKRSMAQQILFVCTGNTCRSPMAEVLFRQLLARRLGCADDELVDHGFSIASAGLAAMVGAPASPESVQICAQHGVDLRAHASQPLTQTLLEQSDWLYTMTAGHREAILARHPHLQCRVELLSRTGQDVTDPIGWGQAAYERCFAEITENLQVLVDELTASGANDSINRPEPES